MLLLLLLLELMMLILLHLLHLLLHLQLVLFQLLKVSRGGATGVVTVVVDVDGVVCVGGETQRVSRGSYGYLPAIGYD